MNSNFFKNNININMYASKGENISYFIFLFYFLFKFYIIGVLFGTPGLRGYFFGVDLTLSNT